MPTMGRPRNHKQRYTVTDASHVTRGFAKTFVTQAIKLKTFTRDGLLAKFPDVATEKLLRYFYYLASPKVGAITKVVKP